jgi:hypothetical protein
MELSIRCIQVIAGVLGRAGEEGQRKRLEAARTGTVTWQPPRGLGSPEADQDALKAAAAAKAAQSTIIQGNNSPAPIYTRQIGDSPEL